MTKLEIPENPLPKAKLFREGSVGDVVVEMDCGNNPQNQPIRREVCRIASWLFDAKTKVALGDLFALAPAMAEEIKRLREEVEKVTDDRDRLNLALAQAGEWINAALAKPQEKEPEKAELPAGCEPFDLERFRVEGGMSADGGKAQYIGLRGEFVFAKVDDFEFLFHEDGKAVGCEKKHLQLYCIAKPVTRRPFDLEAALRGEKVVTRGGRMVGKICLVQPEGIARIIHGEITGMGSAEWYSNGCFSAHGIEHPFDLFMERGV